MLENSHLDCFHAVKMAFPNIKQSSEIPFLLCTRAERDFRSRETQRAVSPPGASSGGAGSAELGARLARGGDRHLCF